jgi:hypothetical protein
VCSGFFDSINFKGLLKVRTSTRVFVLVLDLNSTTVSFLWRNQKNYGWSIHNIQI